METVGILHPGEMGTHIAATVRNGGHEVVWASEGRSAESRERAQGIGLTDAGTLVDLLKRCGIVLSVCPPAAAEDMARQIVALGYRGLYADLNAISPQLSQTIGAFMQQAGITYVDGSIISVPSRRPTPIWLHLSGPQASRVADCFAAGPVHTNLLGDGLGQASALKICYAAFTKGSGALLATVVGAAEAMGVREALQHQWSLDGSGLDQQAGRRLATASCRAWRFVGEMEEIATSFSLAGMPSGFHEAAAETYRRMALFRGRDKSPPELEEVVRALVRQPGAAS